MTADVERERMRPVQVPDGCDVSESCYTFPAPVCRYDNPAVFARWKQRLRHDEAQGSRRLLIGQAIMREGLSDKEAVRRFSISHRQVPLLPARGVDSERPSPATGCSLHFLSCQPQPPMSDSIRPPGQGLNRFPRQSALSGQHGALLRMWGKGYPLLSRTIVLNGRPFLLEPNVVFPDQTNGGGAGASSRVGRRGMDRWRLSKKAVADPLGIDLAAVYRTIHRDDTRTRHERYWTWFSPRRSELRWRIGLQSKLLSFLVLGSKPFGAGRRRLPGKRCRRHDPARTLRLLLPSRPGYILDLHRGLGDVSRTVSCNCMCCSGGRPW